jgi:hypothetical protein
MTPKPTTRDVQKSLYINFLKKAEVLKDCERLLEFVKKELPK